MSKRSLSLWAIALTATLVPTSAVAQAEDRGLQSGDPAARAEIRTRLEAAAAGSALWAAGRRLYSVDALRSFYVRHDYEPVWTSERLRALLDQLETARGDGLDPLDYHAAALRGHLAAGDERARADRDLLATDAFLTLGSHLLHGRVNPATLEPEWFALRRTGDMTLALDSALYVDGASVGSVLDAKRPVSPRYRALRELYSKYQRLASAGGWGQAPGEAPGPLEVGVRHPSARWLKHRLSADGDYPLPGTGATADDMVDGPLVEAVRRFQMRYGLSVDGVPGPGTWAALAVSLPDRTDQVAVNLERWRWLPNDLGTRHLEVNIAGFTVDLVEVGQPTRRFRGIVGREYTQTPSFSDQVRYLVLAPAWNVPYSIAAREEFPAIRADRARLGREGYTLIDQQTNQVVAASEVDWTATAAQLAARFRLRQEPGPRNSLGRVKFMFPNRFNVYLHDTPGRQLFERVDRSFSHGCVRVDRSLELAHALIGRQGWTPERIEAAADRTRETAVYLDTPVPVHLLYWTAWVDPDGTVRFQRDLYGRDAAVLTAFMADPFDP